MLIYYQTSNILFSKPLKLDSACDSGTTGSLEQSHTTGRIFFYISKYIHFIC